MIAAEKIADIAKGHKVFIQGHNYPDADAVASAYGMQRLLEHNGISSEIICVGSADQLSVTLMIETLGIKLTQDENANQLNEDAYVIIVDAQKNNSNVKNTAGEGVICIDHHPLHSGASYQFSDIVPDAGACSSIVAGYFFEAGTVPDTNTATALIYGIMADTLNLKRGTSQLDVEMFYRLYPLADKALLKRLESNSMDSKSFKAFGEAVKNIKILDGLGIVRLDSQCSDALVAEISDFILDLNEIRSCVVYAFRDNGIKLSARSEAGYADAGAAVSEALEGIGYGGGHYEMAGGFVPVENVTSQIDDLIQSRFVKAFKNHK